MSDWRSDVCSSDLRDVPPAAQVGACAATRDRLIRICAAADLRISGSSLPNATLSRRFPAPGDAPWPDSRVRPRAPSRTTRAPRPDCRESKHHAGPARAQLSAERTEGGRGGEERGGRCESVWTLYNYKTKKATNKIR